MTGVKSSLAPVQPSQPTVLNQSASSTPRCQSHRTPPARVRMGGDPPCEIQHHTVILVRKAFQHHRVQAVPEPHLVTSPELSATSRCFLDTSDDSTTSLRSLFPCLTTLCVKKFSLRRISHISKWICASKGFQVSTLSPPALHLFPANTTSASSRVRIKSGIKQQGPEQPLELPHTCSPCGSW